MKKINFLVFILILTFSCSSDDSDGINNGFSINGSNYSTNFAYNDIGSSVFIFSSIDRSLDSFIEVRGRFDLHSANGNLEPITYTTNNGGIRGVVEFDENIIKENGEFLSFGDSLAFTCCSETSSNNFQSGSVTINSIEYNSDGRVSQIEIDYEFRWDGININGNYSGQVALEP